MIKHIALHNIWEYSHFQNKPTPPKSSVNNLLKSKAFSKTN